MLVHVDAHNLGDDLAVYLKVKESGQSEVHVDWCIQPLPARWVWNLLCIYAGAPAMCPKRKIKLK